MRKAIVLTLSAAAVAAGTVVASPATAQDTTAEVVVTAGTLSIAVSTVGTTVQLATAAVPGTTITSGALGTTKVNDTRGASIGWTANISATDFVAKDANLVTIGTIPVGNASVLAGATGGLAALPTTCGTAGVATFTTTAMALATTAKQLAKCAHLDGTTAIGASSLEWANSLNVSIPGTAKSGTYRSTVTQSVQ